MARRKDKPVATPSGRQIEVQDEKPRHLVSRSGPGRTRKPTEFDDMVPAWYQEGKWVKIPAAGDTEDEQLADLEEVYKAVQRAVSLHDLGASRIKENDPSNDEFSGYGVWVHVRDMQKRPRKNKDDGEDETSDEDSE